MKLKLVLVLFSIIFQRHLIRGECHVNLEPKINIAFSHFFIVVTTINFSKDILQINYSQKHTTSQKNTCNRVLFINASSPQTTV